MLLLNQSALRLVEFPRTAAVYLTTGHSSAIECDGIPKAPHLLFGKAGRLGIVVPKLRSIEAGGQ